MFSLPRRALLASGTGPALSVPVPSLRARRIEMTTPVDGMAPDDFQYTITAREITT